MEYMFMPLKRYADFSGRSRRMEFWMWQLFQIIVYVGVTVLMMIMGGGMMMTGGDPSAMAAAGGGIMIILALYALYALAVLIPSIAVSVRRLHDTNRSGWWILAPLAPYILVIIAGVMVVNNPTDPGMAGALVMIGMAGVMILGLVLLVFYLLEGTKGPNRFGPDPKGGANEEVFA
jgi:uncharacterized membrane protein YhaH (DUF805 family)